MIYVPMTVTPVGYTGCVNTFNCRCKGNPSLPFIISCTQSWLRAGQQRCDLCIIPPHLPIKVLNTDCVSWKWGSEISAKASHVNELVRRVLLPKGLRKTACILLLCHTITETHQRASQWARNQPRWHPHTLSLILMSWVNMWCLRVLIPWNSAYLFCNSSPFPQWTTQEECHMLWVCLIWVFTFCCIWSLTGISWFLS